MEVPLTEGELKGEVEKAIVRCQAFRLTPHQDSLRAYLIEKIKKGHCSNSAPLRISFLSLVQGPDLNSRRM